MQTRLLIGVFSIFTCILLFVLIRNYIGAMNIYELPEISPYELAKPSDMQSYSSPPDWINRLSGQSEREFIYPASELQVKLLYANNIKKNTKEVFRVSVGVINDYQFFCINQVFGAHNIEYSYYKIGENIWLVVATEDENHLRNVLEQLRHYAIDYTLSKT
ncbi:hypothetical protein LS70_008370 [Helicobacter sp. MIT 11-5569]|uniref:hypothetical protein n=1 Tax=Helicobacter sp. MIT 11-5569 TaxID=1548151 RepID=UPI00051FDB6D|nr:hypothetical protein [Helicobacter sp. MIT 11-5569]TLD81136.1 hypothetical protein LS70_008370 [Helicobacter sp. MIT 11-5569]